MVGWHADLAPDMVPRMHKRSPVVRALALFWALVQLASPGLSAVADGRLSLESAAQPATHIEATTSSTCPVVHSPDCGMCRYLSGAFAPQAAQVIAFFQTCDAISPIARVTDASDVAQALPRGRSPPTT